jgi:FAD/FMN-containing dehydrogenase
MPSLAELRERHRGPVIAPGDTGYDLARATFNATVDRRPELVVRPLDVADVVTAVRYAAGAGLPISVRGGGHGVAGHCVGDGSLAIDLRLMRYASVDPEARTATCGGGALWEDLDPACQRDGLATPGGTFGDTGVAGLTLGGGLGHLSPSFGLTLDNLIRATVVIADGSVVSAAEEENGELFWALRGGGGNFGVVVEFTFRLHPIGLLLGGYVNYRIEDAVAVLPVWRDLMANAPDNLASFGQIGRDRATGTGVVNASVCWVGDIEEGREAVKPLVAAEPVQSTLRPMYYSELQDIYGRVPFGLRNYWSGRFLRELPDELLALTTELFLEDRVIGGVLLEPLHGAPARVPPDATAFAGREARWNATFINIWESPDDDEREIAVPRAFSSSLAPWAAGGGYLNYASEAVSADGLEAEFGAERLRRLKVVKREYDPGNAFRFNHNIAP